MLCVPSARADVVNEATPLLRAMLPEISVSPSRNCTEPLPVVGVNVAVNVTLSPATDGFVPAVKLTAKLLPTVRKSTGLLRGFWKFMGQSIRELSNGTCVSRIVSRPGLLLFAEFAPRGYATAISVVPLWLKSPSAGAGRPPLGPRPLLPGMSHDFATVPSL